MTQYQSWNHYVPKLYLKRFASPSGFLWRYRCVVSHADVREWDEVNIKNVAAQDYLYSFADDAGESDQIERWLNEEFENPAEDVITRAVKHQSLTRNDWQILIRFFAAQSLRTPAHFIAWMPVREMLLQSAMSDMAKELQAKLPSLDNGSFVGEIRPSPYNRLLPIRYTLEDGKELDKRVFRVEGVAGRKLWLSELKDMLTASESLNCLLRQRWTILCTTEEVPWHTTDHPAISLQKQANGKHGLGIAWGLPHSVLMLPLDPTHLLYAEVGEESPAKYTGVTTAKARDISRVITSNAHRNYFAKKPYAWIARDRPRKVDAKQYDAEAKQWADWHKSNSDAERFT